MAFLRFVKNATVVGGIGYTSYVLHQSEFDVQSIGLFRFGRAAWTVGCIAADYRFSVVNLTDDSDSTMKAWSECHLRSANRLLNLCSANGGVFVKVGQHIAALDHLVPREYVDTLKILHNRAPLTSLKDIRKVIKNELDAELEELFDDFEPTPLGTASLAQVHRARLKDDGPVVAVKVQHPNVRKHSVVDIATMELLVNCVSKLFANFDFRWLAEETRRNLPLELDFYNEGINGERMADILKKFPWVKIPKIYWKYTTERTLVMEFAEGELISNRDYFLKQKIDTVELSNRIEKMYNEMIFINGTVHCDPHPGNILVKVHEYGGEFDIILLDHGLHTKLTEEFRETYSGMWIGVLEGNEPQIIECAKKLGISISKHHAQLLSCMISSKPWSAVKRGLANVPDAITRGKEDEELRKNASKYFGDINKILATVDRQLLLIMKTNDLIRSIAKSLGNDERKSFLTMTRSCFKVDKMRRLRESPGIFSSILIHLGASWFFFKLRIYSFYLWLTYTRPNIQLGDIYLAELESA
ncbi:hypothetical protein RDWZM_009099 [Blomia tropicalis]|uniref:ABC1 atypical kinase-like domain-containing protein n=1 Tax=Blomia tropicalis TaxID=40697 RepID=A0A9Q0M2Z7_BLOTA|nr:hypothetical protein RDWZM_009099 [Blomia tropicalis]